MDSQHLVVLGGVGLMDMFDGLILGGLCLIGVGLSLEGYPIVWVAIGAFLFVWGILPHIKGRR